ncbi:MAG: RNA polymerase sigma factor [Myxococcales bacterium]
MRLGTGGPDDHAWEIRCLERIRRGDRGAFAELYAAFAGRLYAQVLLPRLGDASAAEEALAETFRSALEHVGRYRSQGGSVLRWLSTIAVNKANDLHRDRARSGKALSSFEALVAPLREGPAGSEVERTLDQKRLRTAVDGALALILPRYRQAIELRVLGDLSRAECAQRMQITIGNFDVLLLRALRAFHKAWVDRHGGSEDNP